MKNTFQLHHRWATNIADYGDKKNIADYGDKKNIADQKDKCRDILHETKNQELVITDIVV